MSRVAGSSAGSSAERGFTVSHQKVALELGFASSSSAVLAGYTELTIIPTDRNLKTVFLNSRQCTIHSVTCAGQSAEFTVLDSLTAVTISDQRDVHLFSELKRKLYAAASDGQGGELAITLPPAVRVETSQSAPASVPATPGPDNDAPTPGGPSAAAAAPGEANAITIRINYSLSNPADAIQLIRPTAEAPWRQTHMYTSPTCSDYARCWVPCVDSLGERNTWEFQYVVPRRLAEGPADEESAGEDSHDCVVISTGDLVEQTIHPHNSRKVIYSFIQAAPTSVQHVGFAAGCFKALDLAEKVPSDRPADAVGEAEDASELQMVAFCLPGREEELRNSTAVAKQAMTYFSRDFGSFPFASFKLVFIEDAVVDVHNTSTLSIFSADLLHPPSVIDQALETRQVIAHSLAVQWVGINIIQKTWSDTWLINGLSLYVSGLFWRRLMGNNEYRFRLRKDCDRVCAWDIGMPPIGQLGSQEPPDAATLPFINLKAPLVLHILDRRLCKAGASLGLGRVIPRVLLQAITGELPNNTLSTSSFLRTCRKVSGVDLRKFTEQWIYGSGCPRFFVSSNFNRKKLTIEIHVRQESPAAQFAEYRPEQAVGSNPIKLFEGQMTIRIHEADGRPYEHVLDLKSFQKRYDVPFNTKYKRVRRNTKRFQARQAAAAAAAEGDQDAAEAIGMIDLGFSLAMWEDEEQRERWKVADWTEEEEDVMSQAAYEWIRMDADFEWIASIHVDQPDYMWVSQLQRDRDVVAQLQAVEALANLPNALSSSMLTRTVLVSKYFFRIRTEAAQALVNCAIPHLNYLGLFHLLMLFKTSYCIDTDDQTPDSPGDMLDMSCIPKANDFTDPADYFIRRALVQAISRVRNERGRTLPHVKRFLLNLIRYNDNSTNRYIDDYYLATLLSSLATAFVPIDSSTYGGYVPANEDPDAQDDVGIMQHALGEISRLQELDKLVPSYHNVITLACLDWQAAMVLSHQLPLDLRLFLAYTQQGTFTPVRTSAFSYLLLLSGLKHKIVVRYLFSVLRNDENRIVKRDLAKGVCEALAIAIATGDAPGARQDSVLLEEVGGGHKDPGAADRARDKEMEGTLRVLRREVGRSAAVREGFLGALLAPGVDSEARWALIKLAELLFKPKEETNLPLEARLIVARARVPSTPSVPRQQLLPEAELLATAGIVKTKVTDAAGDVIEQVVPPPATRVAFQDDVQEAAASSPRPTLKLKKAKPLPQAQTGGMTASDVTACRNALKKLYSSKHSFLFINPVDPVRDSAPNYHQIIKDPMDLSTMSNKLEEGLYTDRFAFEKDFNLLVANAKTYTPDPMAFVHKEAEALGKAFQTLWAKTNKTLEQAAAKQAALASINNAAPGLPMESAPATAAAPISGPMAPPPLPVRAPTRPAPPSAATPVASPQSAAGPARPLGLKLKLKSKASADVTADGASSPAGSPALSSSEPQRAVAAAEAPRSATPKVKVKSKSATPRAGSAGSPAPPAPEVAPAQPAYGNFAPPPTAPGEDPVKMGKGEPIHSKQCKVLLQNLKRVPEAILFLNPVDEAYAPGYFSVVHHPMDLETMETKLNSNQYATMDQFASDMVQIFDNAYIYADVTAVQYAEAVRAAFKQEWPKALVRRLEYNDRRALQSMISRIKSSQLGGLFTQPVEEIVKALPHYFDVIPREKARDLGMIGDKLKNDGYGRASDLEADVRLMINNAKTFNASNEAILALVDSFEHFFNKEWKSTLASLSSGAANGSGGGSGGGGGAGGAGGQKKRKDEEGKNKEGGSKKLKA